MSVGTIGHKWDKFHTFLKIISLDPTPNFTVSKKFAQLCIHLALFAERCQSNPVWLSERILKSMKLHTTFSLLCNPFHFFIWRIAKSTGAQSSHGRYYLFSFCYLKIMKKSFCNHRIPACFPSIMMVDSALSFCTNQRKSIPHFYSYLADSMQSDINKQTQSIGTSNDIYIYNLLYNGQHLLVWRSFPETWT